MKLISFLLAVALGLGIGYLVFDKQTKVIQDPDDNQMVDNNDGDNDDGEEDQADEYADWVTLQPGGVISMQIPPTCHGDPGAGTTYIVCETNDGSDPLPSMVVSSDGIQVNVKRYEDSEWEFWDEVISTIRVLKVDRDITVSIQR